MSEGKNTKSLLSKACRVLGWNEEAIRARLNDPRNPLSDEEKEKLKAAIDSAATVQDVLG